MNTSLQSSRQPLAPGAEQGRAARGTGLLRVMFQTGPYGESLLKRKAPALSRMPQLVGLEPLASLNANLQWGSSLCVGFRFVRSSPVAWGGLLCFQLDGRCPSGSSQPMARSVPGPCDLASNGRKATTAFGTQPLSASHRPRVADKLPLERAGQFQSIEPACGTCLPTMVGSVPCRLDAGSLARMGSVPIMDRGACQPPT